MAGISGSGLEYEPWGQDLSPNAGIVDLNPNLLDFKGLKHDFDGQTDGPTYRPTRLGVESRVRD